MHCPFSIYLALKYLKPKRTFLSAVTVISALGVILGVAVLIVVLSVMNGFDAMWRDKILGFDAHITVEAMGGIEEPAEVLEAVNGVEGVVAAAPYIQQSTFLQVDDRIYPTLVRGVDPVLELQVSQVPKHMVEGEFRIEDGLAVIGRDLARQAGLHVGDSLLLYSPHGFADPDEIYLPEELEIGGIFELGMYEFDVGFVLTSLDTARDLARMPGGAVHAVQIATADPLRVRGVKRDVMNALNLQYLVRTWEEMRRPLFAALQVEKNLMFMLLLCITLVAAFSICNTLITQTVQKTREIGLLKAVGFSPGHILRVFLWQGWIQGLFGTSVGLGVGLLVLRYRNGLMKVLNQRLDYELLPKELYHLSEIPAQVVGSDIVLVVVLVMVICTIAGLIPAWRAARLEPARALRYE